MDKESRKTIKTAVGIAAAAVVVAIGIYAVNVALSAPKGQGDAIIQKNSATNWTTAQADFEKRYQGILATDKKISVAKSALDLSPEDKTLQTNYTGVVSICFDKVAGYNAAARSYLSEDFRASDLPASIDDTDPDTDCKE